MGNNKQKFITKMETIYNSDNNEGAEALELINAAVELENSFSETEIDFEEIIKEINVTEEDIATYTLLKELESSKNNHIL